MGKLSFWQFWLDCLKTAFSKSWALGMTVSAVLYMVVPFAPLADNHVHEHQSQWSWIATYLIPVTTLSAIIFYGLFRLCILAPYSVYKTNLDVQNTKLTKLEEQLSESEANLKLINSQKHKENEIASFGESFYDLYQEGRKLGEEYKDSNPVIGPTLDKVSAWQKRLYARLSTEIKKPLFFEYTEIKTTGIFPCDERASQRIECAKIFNQLAFLHRIIKEPGSFISLK